MIDTEKYEVHPGISGYTPQESALEVHPELAQTLVPSTQESQEETPHEQPVQQTVEHEHHDHQHEDDTVQEVENKISSAANENWRQLRKEKERAEYERDLLLKQLEHYQNSQRSNGNNVPSTKLSEEEDFTFNVNPDDLVEGKIITKLDKKHAKELREIKEELKQYKQQTVQQTIRTNLRNQFNDFDKVVSAENIAKLKAMEPELAYTLESNPDLYSVGVSAYKLIKTLGIHKEDLYEADRLRAQKNAAKPKPLASIAPQKAESPLSHANAFANGLSKDLSTNLWKEMQEAMKKA